MAEKTTPKKTKEKKTTTPKATTKSAAEKTTKAVKTTKATSVKEVKKEKAVKTAPVKAKVEDTEVIDSLATALKSLDGKENIYFEAVGRRKTSVARVRLTTKSRDIVINEKSCQDYFPLLRLQKVALAPLDKMKITDKLGVSVKVSGGGINSQAEAICLGIARALIKFDAELKKRLRRFGYVTRDARAVERKKYGLKKARRAPQWRKR